LNDADNDGSAGGITYYNRRLEKARANYDIRHRAVTVFTYELPFGKGRKWMSSGGVKNAVLGGWELAWIQTIQSGPPINITFAGSPDRYLPGASRPNQILPDEQARVPNWDIGPHRFPITAQNRYLNIDAFQYPAAYEPGTLGRNTFTAPGIIWPQASLSKEWPIKERARFILRWDINNPLKYPNFDVPNTAFNTRNPGNFGRFSGTRGSFSDIGSRLNSLIVLRVEW
jgi:hypothetical protein